MSTRRAVVTGLLATGVLLTAGCSNDTSSTSGGGDTSAAPADKGDVNLSGQNFTETQITAAMYQLLLEDAGYTVTTKLVDTRDVYIPEMDKGNVDVATEYVSGLADYLNTTQNGDNADPVSSSDLDATTKALDALAAGSNISILEPADAVDANAFAVTTKFAEDNNVATLSDLAGVGQPIVLAAAPDCEGRTDCEGGLSGDYGIDISKVLPLGYASTQAIDSVNKGESQLVEVASTQAASLAEQGLTVLDDDQHIQPVQNLVPAVNSDFLGAHPDVAETLNQLSAVLTSDDISMLDSQVDLDREDPADVAQQYLTDKSLI
ncbi:MAG: glycine betaine ABC transporter substrate-binding protein [Nocardioidaceae bacterium]